MNLWLIFLTGLTTGGVTCAAMQGGLLASVIASQKKLASTRGFGRDDWAPVAAFLTTKFVSHLALGALLGYLGSRVVISPASQLFFQGVAAFFMLVTALNLLDVHPFFRYFVIQPPHFIIKLLKLNSQSATLFAPAILGVLTIFIPCGVTQAMEVVAVSSGSPTQGAFILGTFVLGTVPMFALIGLATARLSETWRLAFLQSAAVILIGMSLYSVNGIMTALDSPYALERIVSVLKTPVGASPAPVTVDGIQKVNLSVKNSGYSPRYFSVRSGVPVELTVDAGQVYTCALAFRLPAFGIFANLEPETKQVFNFTPKEKGRYTYTCSMGMYSGVMEVI